MKLKTFCLILLLLLVVLATGVVLADDGKMFRRNVSKTPEQVTERANLIGMTFYVPAQTSAGELTTIEYLNLAEEVVDTRDYAKPLVAVYIDALPEEEVGELGAMSGAGFGAHDAHAALSLDDGATWKRTNLSMSADLSSFNLADGHAYPGDAHNMTFAIAGDKVLVGWISKYCDGGSPAYTWTDEEDNDLYPDIWGVAGAQSSVDYTAQGYPEVGEIPYSCVWAARGTLLEVDAEGAPMDGGGFYDIIWTKAERLTSGRRDANRLEMNGDGAAGFMMTWQEDPEGLRPGQGLGPGEGWSGAVVNQQTDLWYSHISIDDFIQVQTSDDDETPVSIYDFTGDTLPKVAVPMALPVRLTDNKMCKVTGSDPYCYVDFDNVDIDGNLILPDDLDTIVQSSDSTLCTETIQWENPGGTILNLCVAKDGRVMQGRVGASRPRVNVQPYDSDGDDVYDSAWTIMGAEESKALGDGAPDNTGGGQPEEEDLIDVGKNMWYYSFDMLNPKVVMQGGMLNQPAVCTPGDAADSARCPNGEGEFYELLTDDFGNSFYETEISRRFSHFSQPIHQIGEAGVSAVLIVKQGILNQGGPADIFLRRLIVPDDFDPTTDNPYAYKNMACEDAEGNSQWVYTDGSNPRYVEGLCLSNMINVSGGSIVSCDGVAGDCAADFPWDGQDDIGDDGFPKVTAWEQTVDNLDDQSWENPYDVSKGHRGFIDGDFIMMMYAWSPNWQANSVGNDHYNLYARRSFDGGETWTTTPAALGGDGTEICENFKNGTEITVACTTYGPGEFQQSRNLSQLVGNKETILDPRYTPTGGIKMLPITDLKGTGFTGYDDDVRDPSKFFIVYETGDNTTVAEGEAVPLDLFYSRAIEWGDEYDLVAYEKDGEIVMGFDWLEHDREDLSGEAANLANNGGTYYYAIWNQWQEDEEENVSNSDAIFRRIFYDDGDEDRAAVADILYADDIVVVPPDESATNETIYISFLGTAKDLDHLGEGIVDYMWSTDLGFVDEYNNDISATANANFCNSPEGKDCKKPGWAFVKGQHNVSFKAMDNEGNWSDEKTTVLYVVETQEEADALRGSTIYMPLIMK